jgi:hypothetical protein
METIKAEPIQSTIEYLKRMNLDGDMIIKGDISYAFKNDFDLG